MRNWFFIAAAVLATAGLCGCGEAGPEIPELAPATGVVTQGGQPIADAIVTFWPENGGSSVGNTDAEGRFELKYLGSTPGAIIGKHTVKISKMSGEAGDELIPRKFNEASKLSKEVTKAGPNEFKFEI
jgi:hypothetical protein